MKFSGERSFKNSAILCLAVITMLQMTVTSADDDICLKPHEIYLTYGRVCSGCYDSLLCDAKPKPSGCYCERCYCRDQFDNCVLDFRCSGEN